MAFMAAGVPNLISFAVVVWVGAVLLRVAPKLHQALLLACVDFASGVVSVLAAAGLAHSFGLKMTGWLAVASAAWFTVHFLNIKKIAPLVRAVAGTAIGWWLISYSKRMSI
jgi:hypothetical protein